ncbi:MAG: NAD(P)H-hydrate dehydratase [Actinobacteria bacterium]|nr:NAD(P)H-hydrate dehydratase [Actinomycetota bacterium]MBU1942739.1 NAD(P)H-hydrate dehydratase [Actinomycetota bacterium]MBU2686061.1 NAD(P)H-hydrate dehydratase [Actinomycetota bacterium]
MKVVLPAEMAAIDRAAMEGEGIPGLELMERAGEAVARAAREMLIESGGRRVAIWCGKGNNGGDGLVVGRLLSGAYEVSIYMAAGPDELAGDARVNLERLEVHGLPVRWTGSVDGVRAFSDEGPFDLVVDALFGTGFAGRPSGLYAEAIEAMNASGRPVLAVDVPSGVDGTTGAVAGPAVKAARTVTFAALKAGLVQFPGAGYAGEVEVADIGIPESLLDSVPDSRMHLIGEEEAAALLPVRAPDAHKWQCGSVLVVGGSPGMTGAAALAANSALRSGAGLVVCAVPEGVHDILEVKTTEVMTMPLQQTSSRTLAEAACGRVVELARRFDVVALGPGLSTDEETGSAVRRLVAELDRPLVLDADGLNAVAERPSLLAERSAPLVVTPHPGEMARLLSIETADVQGDRIGHATRSAVEWGAVVVLKGARTVVAGPSGDVGINSTGNAGMASAGMGDVLTGCIASLMSQGLEPFDAAVAGAYFHGMAADLAANMDGMIGMTAGDVARHLPLALNGKDR